MTTRIQLRRDSTANWAAQNPILASGEIGIETDSLKRLKLGDGSTAWNSLASVGAQASQLTGTALPAAIVSSSLTSVGTIATGVWQGTQVQDTYLATIQTAGKVANSATTATANNTASAIVARDANGDFSARNITAVAITASGAINGQTISNAANFTGTVAVATSLTVKTNTTIGAWGGDATYTMVSVNNDLAALTGNGMFGKIGDATLYFQSTTAQSWRIANAEKLALTASSFTVSAATTAVQALTATTGTFSSNIRGTYLYALNTGANALQFLLNSAGTGWSGIWTDGSNTWSLGWSADGGARTGTMMSWTYGSSTVAFTGGITATTGTFSSTISGTNITASSQFIATVFGTGSNGTPLELRAGASAVGTFSTTMAAFPGGISGTTGTFNGALTATSVVITSAGTGITSNTTAAAANFNAVFKAQRSGTDHWWLALDASDQFSILNAAGNANNLVITDAGAGIFRAGITTGSTTLHATSVALANGAAAAAGTLTNAPAAGNPTKWVPINDNGTTRYIPTW